MWTRFLPNCHTPAEERRGAWVYAVTAPGAGNAGAHRQSPLHTASIAGVRRPAAAAPGQWWAWMDMAATSSTSHTSPSSMMWRYLMGARGGLPSTSPAVPMEYFRIVELDTTYEIKGVEVTSTSKPPSVPDQEVLHTQFSPAAWRTLPEQEARENRS
jgi:hypothetical protein